MSGFHTPYDLFFLDFKWSKLVLYSDGQLIITGKPYQQKMLSTGEINHLLSELDASGFYTVESNQRHDLTDKLYNFGDQYERIYDALWYCVRISGDKPRELCAYEPFLGLLVPEVKNVLEFLDDYQPEDMVPYYPDRILLWVQVGRNPYDDNLPKEAMPWMEPSLVLETTSEKILYAQGEMARRLFTQLGNGSGKVVTQDNIEYTVYLEIVLPHEEITNIYEQ